MMCSVIDVVERVGLRSLFNHCPEPAAGWLVAPDGKDVPGGHYCATHGQKIIDEFRVVLNEVWTLRPLTEVERHVL